MGQTTSRLAAKQVQKAARARGAAPTPTKKPPGVALGRPQAESVEATEDAQLALQQRHEREEEDELQQQQPRQPPPPQVPHPDQNTGFFRGAVADPRDVAQANFLVHQRGGSSAFTELAPELLKFLQDAGPIQKRVNKEFTSKRIVEEMERSSLEDITEQENLHRLEAARRDRRDMRLVEGIDGFSTPRSTNFFTEEDDEEENVKDFGLHDLELYNFLKQQQQIAQSTEAGSGEREGTTVVQSFYQRLTEHRKAEAAWTDDEQDMHQKWLKDTAQYLELPVIIKDEDGTYVGIWPKDLNTGGEFSARRKLDVVPESRVKLVVADIFDMQRKEVKKIK